MESKYLTRFQSAAVNAKADYELIGDFILVEEIKDEEMKTKSGIILATGSQRQVNGVDADKPTFARVLMVGNGFYSEETGEDLPLGVEPGDVILVGKHSIKKFSIFGKLMSYGDVELGLTKESEIQLRFKGQEGFERFFSELNRDAKEA